MVTISRYWLKLLPTVLDKLLASSPARVMTAFEGGKLVVLDGYAKVNRMQQVSVKSVSVTPKIVRFDLAAPVWVVGGEPFATLLYSREKSTLTCFDGDNDGKSAFHPDILFYLGADYDIISFTGPVVAPDELPLDDREFIKLLNEKVA